MGKRSRLRQERRKAKMVGNPGPDADLGVKPGEVKAAMWAVAFLDLLGYREQLLATDLFPPPVDSSKVSEAFADLVGRRRALVDGPRLFLQSAANSHKEIAGLPPAAEKLKHHLSKLRVATTGFADSVVLETPLDGTMEKAPIVALWELVMASASTVLMHLALGSPVRGGIEVGFGAWAHGQLHSAATAKAVMLEKCAKYPRVLVGDRFRAYLENEMTAPDVPGVARIQRSVAEMLKALLYSDPNDPPNSPLGIDYLGAPFKDALISYPPENVRAIWLFAHASRDKFAKANRPKEQGYYERLIAYVEPRLEIWGLGKSI